MIYVRDRGQGFDPDGVPEDRQGIAQIDPGPHGPVRRFGGHPLGTG